MSSYTSKWDTTQPVPLTRESFLRLLDGEVPVIKTPSFIGPETSEKLVANLVPNFSSYMNTTGPAVQKVGIAQFEFQAQAAEDFVNRSGDGKNSIHIVISLDLMLTCTEKQSYFDEVAKVKTLHDDLAKIAGENIWAKVVSTLAALVPEWDVAVASEGEGKDYFSGIFRNINKGVPIHCDWCPYDCLTEDWILSKVTKQAVFNLYISHVKGGDTTLFDVQWTPDALNFRDPASYGYFPDLVAGRNKCSFHPEVGDLCIFNSRNMHTVQPVEEGSAQRIALASFMGLLPSEVTGGRPKLMFWS